MTGAAENAQGSADPGMKPLALGRSRRGLVTLVLGCAAFVAIGVFLLLDDGWAGKLAGLAAVLFFGLCGGYALWKSLREPALLTLTPEGVRVHSGGFLPWADFEAAGMGRVPGAPGGTEVLGIRMKSCERYAASFTSEQLRLARGAAKGGQLSGASLPSAGILSAAVESMPCAPSAARSAGNAAVEPGTHRLGGGLLATVVRRRCFRCPGENPGLPPGRSGAAGRKRFLGPLCAHGHPGDDPVALSEFLRRKLAHPGGTTVRRRCTWLRRRCPPRADEAR